MNCGANLLWQRAYLFALVNFITCRWVASCQRSNCPVIIASIHLITHHYPLPWWTVSGMPTYINTRWETSVFFMQMAYSRQIHCSHQQSRIWSRKKRKKRLRISPQLVVLQILFLLLTFMWPNVFELLSRKWTPT